MKKKKITIAVSVFVTIFVVYLAILHFYFSEEGNKRTNFTTSSNVSNTDDYLEITANIITVDLQKENLDIRLDFKPHGSLVQPDGALTHALTVYPSSVNGTTLEFPAGQRMFSHDVTFDLYDGEVTDYPFDNYKARIESLTLMKMEKDSELQKNIPMKIDFYSYHHGISINSAPFENNESGQSGFNIVLKRSNLIVNLAIFCMLITWGLAIAAVLVLCSVIFQGREADIDKLALLTGLIIGIYFFRAAFPDSPPTIGTLSDFLAFFWAESIVSIVSIIYTLIWFRWKKEAV